MDLVIPFIHCLILVQIIIMLEHLQIIHTPFLHPGIIRLSMFYEMAFLNSLA